MSTYTRPITVIEALEAARGLHDPAPIPAEYPEYSRGMANIISDLYGFDAEDIPVIIAVIRQQMSVAEFAAGALQVPWQSEPSPSERQIATKRELADWLIAGREQH